MDHRRSVLVDSSFYIREIRSKRDPLTQLHPIAESGALSTCGVITAEVGRGLISPKIRTLFQEAFSVMCYFATDQRLWSQVEEMAWNLDRRGKNIPLTDIVIACCAIQTDSIVLTYDHHFLEIPHLETALSIAEIEFD